MSLLDKKGKIRPLVDELATEETLQSVAGFNIPPFDETISTETTPTEETHEFKLLGVTQATLTVTFSDSTKTFITHIVKS